MENRDEIAFTLVVVFGSNRKRKDCKCKSAKEAEIYKAVEAAFGRLDREELIRKRDEIRM